MNSYTTAAYAIIRRLLVIGLLMSAAVEAKLAHAEAHEPPLLPSPYLVKDINQATGDASPDLSHAQWVGGKALFWADDGIGGTGLWKSDGTSAGTTLVKYISLGPMVATCEFTSSASATLIYFLLTSCGAYSPSENASLWRSDGTPQGTWEVFRTAPDKKIFNLFFQLNDRAFLGVWDREHGTELWKTDGTPGSLTLFMDFYPGQTSGVADFYGPKYVVLNGVGYFTANDQVHGSELWRTDGTLAGTRMVKDITPDVYSGWAYGLAIVGSKIFFWVWDGTQYALWSSDGTAVGTRPAGAILGLASLDSLIPFQNNLYFFVIDAAKTISLWRSDGTVSGTKRVKTLPPALDDARPYFYNTSNQQIVFELTGVNSLEYWASDGTETGTHQLKSFAYDRSKGAIPNRSNIATLNSKFYFVKDCDLWETAGTPNSTRVIETLWSRYGQSDCVTHITDLGVYYTYVMPFNNALVFAADTPTYGEELWKTSGLPNSATLLKDNNASNEATTAHVNGMTDLNGTLIFVADDRLHGAELWRSDGTYTGTTLVKDIRPGATSSFLYGGNSLVVCQSNGFG
jgi:ELWxxDGT repeat protein